MNPLAQPLLLSSPAARRSDAHISVLVWSSALVVSAVFLWIIGSILSHGIAGISWEFLTRAPQFAGRAGGIAPILISTLLILCVCVAAALPIGLCAAVWLSEFTSRQNAFGRFVQRSLDILAAVPSIVFGLFGNAFFCVYLGMGFSILSGGLTLACMVLPILIRSAEESLRAVPGDYRLSAAALGMSRTSTLIRLILPAAAPGLAAGLVLGIGRALAETAALIFTSGYVDRMPSSLLDSGRALSVHIFDLSMNVTSGERNAAVSALVLLVLLLTINSAVLWLANRARGRLTPE